MNIITLHYFDLDNIGGIISTNLKEIHINTDSIHRFEKGNRTLIKRTTPVQIEHYSGTDIYLNEYGGRYENKKHYFVTENPDYILSRCNHDEVQRKEN